MVWEDSVPESVSIMVGATSHALAFLRDALHHRLQNLFTFRGYTSLLEGLVSALFLYLAFTRAYLPRNTTTPTNSAHHQNHHSSPPLDDAEIERKIRAWKPEPLERPEFRDGHQQTTPSTPGTLTQPDQNRIILASAAGPSVAVVGVDAPVTNLSSCNFLGLVGDPNILNACKQTMQKYGCGACGPRGFYGTVDVHLECEAALAKFMGVEDAILYSFGSATGNSVVPAFCKRGDVVVCDKAINFALQTGVNLSRADVLWFEHNDMDDLENVLKKVTAADKHRPRRALEQRRFIIVEGIYANHGDIAPLDLIVHLKNKYLFRLLLDESMSIGVLGASGHGALEHFNVQRSDVEISIADLANAFATVGGVCVGDRAVVSHQRLSGAGYCFSASQPPFLATAATEAVSAIETRGRALVMQSRENIAVFRRALNIPVLEEAGWVVEGDQFSPLMHVRVEHGRNAPEGLFRKIQSACLKENVLLATPRYVDAEAFVPSPSLRIAISAAHDKVTLEKSAMAVRKILLEHAASF